MATEDSSGTAAQTSVRTTNAGTHKAFIVALLLRVILAGLIHLESLQGTEPPRTLWAAPRRVRKRSQPPGIRGIGRKARTESKKWLVQTRGWLAMMKRCNGSWRSR